MERDIEYENNNIGYDWQHTEEYGGGIKCKNYELCETILPKWWFECKGNYLCTSCHIMFGTWGTHTGKGILETSNNIECVICFENKRGISYPNCNHMLCIDCFKRCYYKDTENEPQFPYPDIIDLYFNDTENDIENSKWETDYPLIKKYNYEWDNWYDNREHKYKNETYLRKCSICRK